ncbi:MAG: hydrolase [Frondihabitans sp.]|nr:hydrolase [Frondihabitans sp.]
MDITALTLTETGLEPGTAPTALVLHGGGGPFTVANIAEHLAATHHVITPTHPGWNGTARPDDLDSIPGLARLYLDLLAKRDLHDDVVIGSSLGGWIAAEMAATDAAARIGRLVIIDGGGIEVESEPMVDFFSLDPRGVAEHSWYDADAFFVDPATLDPARVRAQRANMQTMGVYAGDPYMHDPALPARLADITAPTLLIWGAADRVFTPGYGRAYAGLIPGARFELVERAGHLPHLERPEVTLELVDAFAGAGSAPLR